MAMWRELLVARGNTSDVYRWGDDSVVKVLRPGIPDEWAAREALTTHLVHAAGLPAPAVLDVTTVDGRPAIVFQRVEGISMWERMVDRPGEIPRLARMLAELQAEISATPAPADIPRIIDRLCAGIEQAPLLTAAERDIARLELARLPEGNALCHFDVHPNNVLLTGGSRLTIIDWFDAAAGHPAADIVRSSVLMRRDAAHCHLPVVDSSIIDVAHDEYIAAVARGRCLEPEMLLGWEGPVVAARLAEPVGRVIRRALKDTWLALCSAQPTRLSAALQMTRPVSQGKRAHDPHSARNL